MQAGTIGVLPARLDAVEARVGELVVPRARKDERIAELEAENAEMKRRLAQNSTLSGVFELY